MMDRSMEYQPCRDSSWIEEMPIWTNKKNKITLQDDIAICVTILENDIMRRIARDRLRFHYNVCIDPEEGNRRNPCDIFNWFRECTTRLRSNNIFGLDLQDAMLIDEEHPEYVTPRINHQYRLYAPHFIVQCVKFIEKYSGGCTDIFIEPGNPNRIIALQNSVLSSRRFLFTTQSDVREVATLLKMYLLSLPTGLFTDQLEMHFANARAFSSERRIKVLRYLVQMLPMVNRHVLYLLMSLFRQILGPNVTSRLLNDIFSPILFRNAIIVSNKSMGILYNLIEDFEEIYTLKAITLHTIYEQMKSLHPAELNEHMYRRTEQCICQLSDVPLSMRLLVNQRRSYDSTDNGTMNYRPDFGKLTSNEFILRSRNRSLRDAYLQPGRESFFDGSGKINQQSTASMPERSVSETALVTPSTSMAAIEEDRRSVTYNPDVIVFDTCATMHLKD